MNRFSKIMMIFFKIVTILNAVMFLLAVFLIGTMIVYQYPFLDMLPNIGIGVINLIPFCMNYKKLFKKEN